MGYYNNLSIDTRTCGEADDDAWIEQRDRGYATNIVSQMWQSLAQRYALAYQISYYAAQADIEARRRQNGDGEACAWFTRILDGERLTWNDKAV